MISGGLDHSGRQLNRLLKKGLLLSFLLKWGELKMLTLLD
jgi:hypothetical protein